MSGFCRAPGHASDLRSPYARWPTLPHIRPAANAVSDRRLEISGAGAEIHDTPWKRTRMLSLYHFRMHSDASQELELTEVKFGFVPMQDQVASKIRRRYRLIKGGHPQLILIHYSRGQSIRESVLSNCSVCLIPCQPSFPP